MLKMYEESHPMSYQLCAGAKPRTAPAQFNPCTDVFFGLLIIFTVINFESSFSL